MARKVQGPSSGGVSDHTLLTNIGTNTHAQIDTHLAAANPHSGSQPLDADLTAVAALAPSDDDVLQRKAGVWTNRTMAQIKVDLVLVKADVGLGNVDNTSDATKDAATTTLSNKTLNNTNVLNIKDTSFVLQWFNGSSRQAKFNLGSISVGVQRTFTLPNADGTVALTSDISALSSVYQPLDADLTDIAALADASGDIIIRGALGWERLPKGTDGQVLKLASGLPAWGTDSTGGGGALTVSEGGVALDVTVTNIDFDGTAFNLTESPEDEANVAMNFGSGAGQPAEGNHTHSYQPLDSDLTTIAGLTATTDNVIQAVASAWASRTPAQLKTTLALVKADVGLGNVDNTSDATKNAASATLTNKTLTAPVIADFTSMGHDHLDADDGGTLTIAAIPAITATAAELNHTDGVTSPIQGQIDGKQPLDSDLTAIAGLTATTDNIIQSVSSAWASRTPAQLKTTLALVKGDVGLGNVTNDAQLKIASNLSDLNNAGTARTNLGVAIGSDVQAYDADLADIAAIADASGDIIIRGAAGWERLPKGTDGQVLKLSSGLPSWGTDATGGGSPGETLLLEGNNPDLKIHELDAATDEKWWHIRASGGNLVFGASDDPDTSENQWLVVNRTGIAITSQLDGNLTLLGDPTIAKANAALTIDSSSNAQLTIDAGAAADQAQLSFKQAGTTEWVLGRHTSGGGEPGGFFIYNGDTTNYPVVINDATNVVTFFADPLIPDEAYGVGWNGSLEPPTKNAVYDKIETMGGGGSLDVHEDGSSEQAATTILDFRTGLNVTPVSTNEAEVSVDLGTGATQAAAGDHLHTGVYQPASTDLTDLVDRWVSAVDPDGDKLRFRERPANGTNYAELTSPTAIGSNYQVVLPSSGGTLELTSHNHSGVYQPLDADLTAIAALADPNEDQYLMWDDSTGAYVLKRITKTIPISIGDGTAAPATGIWTAFRMPVAGEWVKNSIGALKFTSGSTGSIVIDIWKDSHANFPPVVGDTITASAKPTLSAANKSEDATLTGWTKTFAAGDWFVVNIDSVATITLATLMLDYREIP